MDPEKLPNGRILELLERFDPPTALHCKRVSTLSEAIGAGFGLAGEDLAQLALAGLLHDVGMLEIPKSILRKTSALSYEEETILKRHVEKGVRLAEAAGYSPVVVEVIRQHHERLDGSGYPYGLVGEQIGWYSRIVAVADVFTAMTDERSYRRALSEKMVIGELKRDRKFDREVVGVLEKYLASPSGRIFASRLRFLNRDNY